MTEATTADITLNAELRTDLGSAASGRMRAAGTLPAVIYGKGGPTVTVSIDHLEFRRLFQRPEAREEEFNLVVNGTAERVRIQELQRDPVRNFARHIDFIRV